jgi:hypothetical protein
MKSPTDRPSIAGRSAADRTATAGRSRATRAGTTNNPLSRADGRTAQGRRTRDLYRSFAAALGNPDDTGTLALILVAAELIVVAENARRDHLLGGNPALAGVVSVENLAARALKRLGLNKPVRQPRKSFAEKMAEREAAEAAALGGGA